MQEVVEMVLAVGLLLLVPTGTEKLPVPLGAALLRAARRRRERAMVRKHLRLALKELRLAQEVELPVLLAEMPGLQQLPRTVRQLASQPRRPLAFKIQHRTPTTSSTGSPRP